MEQEVENLKEENYKLTLKYTKLQQNSRAEIEDLKEELSLKDAELHEQTEKLKLEGKQRESELLERITILNEDLDHSHKARLDLEEECSSLKKSLESLKSTQSNRFNRNENVEALKIANDQLNLQLLSREETLAKLQEKVNELTLTTEKFREEKLKLEDELEIKETCIIELKSRIKEIEDQHQEEMACLQQSLMNHNSIDDGASTDPNKRGNSLFSEVEERRVRVEDELKKLRERCARLASENVELSEKLEKGDSRSGLIASQIQLIKKSDTDAKQEYRRIKAECDRLFDMNRERLNQLRVQYINKIMELKNHMPPTGAETEAIRDERDKLLFEKMQFERDLTALKRDLTTCKRRAEHAEANEKIARTKLQAALEKYGKLESAMKPSNFKSPAKNSGRSVNLNVSSTSNNSSYECTGPTVVEANVVPNLNTVDNLSSSISSKTSTSPSDVVVERGKAKSYKKLAEDSSECATQ